MLKNLISKKRLIAAVIFIGAVLIVVGILLFAKPFEAQLASQAINLTEKVGEGIFAPACGSSSGTSFCEGTNARVTLNYAYDNLHGTCRWVNFYRNGIKIGSSPWLVCAGSYTDIGPLANNTNYIYTIQYVFDTNQPVGGSDTVTVATPNCAPTVDIKANNSDGPISIPYNTSATLSWTATGFNSCTASGGWSGSKPTSPAWPATTNWNIVANGYPGSLVLRTDGTGTIFGQNLNNVVLNNAAVSFTRPSGPQNYTGTLQSNGANIVGTFTQLGLSYNWSAIIIGSAIQWFGSGSESTGNLTSSQTYTLSCTGWGGTSGSDSVTVNVSAPPPTACNGGVDIGLRMNDGTVFKAAAQPGDESAITSSLRIFQNGRKYGIVLVDPSDANASKYRVQTPSGIKAICKLP